MNGQEEGGFLPREFWERLRDTPPAYQWDGLYPGLREEPEEVDTEGERRRFCAVDPARGEEAVVHVGERLPYRREAWAEHGGRSTWGLTPAVEDALRRTVERAQAARAATPPGMPAPGVPLWGEFLAGLKARPVTRPVDYLERNRAELVQAVQTALAAGLVRLQPGRHDGLGVRWPAHPPAPWRPPVRGRHPDTVIIDDLHREEDGSMSANRGHAQPVPDGGERP